MRAGRWSLTGRTDGSGTTLVWAIATLIGLGWLTWPLWGSTTAPGRADASAEAPWLVAAQLGMTVLLGGLVVRSARSPRVLTPVVLGAALSCLMRAGLTPQSNGIEPVFWVPLLIGATMGPAVGVLAGWTSCLASSAVIGTLSTPLPGQVVVWGLWGLAGGTLHRLGRARTWWAGIVWALALGPVSGVLLNLIGWSAETADPGQTFIVGLSPWRQAGRLWSYTRATSLAFDMSRAVTNAVVWAIASPWLLRGMRAAFAPDLTPAPVRSTGVHLDPAATRRRASSPLLRDDTTGADHVR